MKQEDILGLLSQQKGGGRMKLDVDLANANYLAESSCAQRFSKEIIAEHNLNATILSNQLDG